MKEMQARKPEDETGPTLSSIPEEAGVPTPTENANCAQEQTNYGSTRNLEDKHLKVLYNFNKFKDNFKEYSNTSSFFFRTKKRRKEFLK